MNLYLLERTDAIDWDNYDSFVVASESEDNIRNLTPNGKPLDPNDIWNSWANSIEDVKVTLIGTTTVYKEGDIVISSFNAG